MTICTNILGEKKRKMEWIKMSAIENKKEKCEFKRKPKFDNIFYL